MRIYEKRELVELYGACAFGKGRPSSSSSFHLVWPHRHPAWIVEQGRAVLFARPGCIDAEPCLLFAIAAPLVVVSCTCPHKLGDVAREFWSPSPVCTFVADSPVRRC